MFKIKFLIIFVLFVFGGIAIVVNSNTSSIVSIQQSNTSINNTQPLQGLTNSGSSKYFSPEDYVPFTPTVTANPFVINGDSNIASNQYVTGGNGLVGNPYIIESLNITASTTYLIQITNTRKYITIQNCFIDGESTTGSTGIYLRNASNVVINNIYFQRLDDGVLISFTNNMIVQNSQFEYIDTFSAGIYAANSNNVIFRNNNIMTTQTLSDGIYFYNGYNTSILNNNVSNFEYGIFSDHSTNTTVFNNVVFNASYNALRCVYSNTSIFSYNNFSSSIMGVDLYESFNILIKNNFISNSRLYGIIIESNSNHNVINGNSVIGSSTSNSQDDIYLYSSNWNIFLNNSFKYSLDQVNLTNSNFNVFSFTNFNSGFGNGTNLFNSNYNFIGNSSFDSSMNFDIFNLGGNANKIIENHFSGANDYEVFIFSGNDITVERNAFLGLSPFGGSQAFDNGNNNFFEFNYWQDWTSPDTNNDGIVDIPLSIDGMALNNDSEPLSLINEIYNSPSQIIGSLSNTDTSSTMFVSILTSTSENNTLTSSTSKSTPGFTSFVFVTGILVLTALTLFKRRKNSKKP